MRFSKTLTGLLATLALVSCQPSYADVVGVTGGHWSKHFISDTVTNEEHAWVSFRYNWFTIGRFNNSYKQVGFSGESYHIGVIHDFELIDDVGPWNGRVVGKLSGGLMRGYTTFAGHDWSNKDVTPYLAGGPFFQQAIGQDGFEAEVGVMLLGDAALPSAGLMYRF